MKKILLTISAFFFFCAFGIEEFKDVGIAKYAVLEVTQNYTPIRLEPNENSKRITHLPIGTVLFSTKESENYFFVELDENNQYYVNKKHVELQAIIPEKRIEDVEEIDLQEKKDRYIAEIKTEMPLSFIFFEQDGNLRISFYDVNFDPTRTKIKNNLKNFQITDLISNKFDILYENPDKNKPFFGYDVQKNDDGYKLIIKKSPKINPNMPLKDIKVLVDAGHGGIDNGVCAFGLKEKKINLQIAKRLKKELKKRGAKAYMTRDTDETIGLYDRVDIAKEKDVDISISIHQNSLPDRSKIEIKHGVGTYYYQTQAEPLAKMIQRHLLHDTKFQDDKVNYTSFVMTRTTLPVGVLVECGYLICENEAKCLANKKFQKRVARAIAKGTAQYLRDNF